jgi:hypothetical protein
MHAGAGAKESVCENREKPPALKRMINVEILSPER